MYGKWLYKEISTEYGACKVEIYRKNYTGVSIEIGALAANSLSIALENLGSITDPIGKSVCSFSIIDTDQVEYDDFFTPDATALKVVVSTRVGSGAFVARWSGYVTPDFFAENLSYRTPISISARDNIGYLNDVDFDLTATTITVRELIQSAFRKIAEDYPMSLFFVTQKQTAEGILAIDATISTTLLREMSWGEALETILHDLGLQMRWVDNNTIAVLDLFQIPEYYATQGFNFIDASGYREIAPAWRELSQEQNYGVRENFFEGWLREDNITFVKTENIRIPLSMGGVTGLVPMRYYTPNNWGVAGNTFVINPKDYVYFGTYGQMAQPFGERIFFTGVEKDATNIANNYMSYRQDVYASNRPMRITFKAFTSVMATGGIGNNDALLAYDPANRFMDFATGDTLQLGLKVNLLLHVGTRTYILGQNWEEINGAETNSLYFVLPKIGQVDGNSVTPNEEEITIDVNTIPNDGVLELRIYGFTIHNKTNLQEDAGSATYDWLRMVSYINEVKYTYNIDNPDTGRYSQVEVNKHHNIKDTQSYTFGQIPVEGGAVNAFAGGLFKADGNELVGFQRNADATNYNLLELVGRELIHFNKKNYNRLSGTIKNLNKEPLMFNRLFVREGKKYAPYNYSLNVISNEMNITSMQEVEPYETATFNTIDSQITTGGGTVSGGNNTILQYSEEAGNEKRLYEMQTATEQEKNDAYVLVDKAGFPEARKVHVSELGGIDVRELEQYLESNGYATLKRIWEVDSANAVVRTTYNVVSEQEIISNRRASGSGSGGGGGISEITAQMVVDALGYVPYSSLNPAGYITSSALNGYAKTSDIPSLSGYATENWVSNNYQPKGNYLTSVAWGDVSGKPTTLGGYGITDALSKSGGIINGRFELSKVVDGSNIAAGIVVNADATDGVRRAYIVLDATSPLASGSDYVAIQAYSDGHCDFDLPADGYINIGRSALRVYDNGNVNVGPVVNNSYRLTVEGTLNATTIYQNGQTLDKYYLPLSGGVLTGWLDFTENLRIGYLGSALGVHTPYGWSYFGMQNSSWCHIYTDAPAFYMDKPLYVDGGNSVYHTGNFNPADYLPLSGGTISGDYNALKVKRNNNYGAFIQYENNQGVLGVLGIDTDGTPILFRGSQLNNADTILHSGNYSSYALPLSGGTLNDSATLTVHMWNVRKTVLNGNNIIFDFSNDTGGYGGGLRHITPYGEKRLLEFGSGGDVHMDFDLNVHGNLIATGEVISSRRATSSDARLKDNINRLIAEDCLAMVRSMQPSSWDWKENGDHSMGFIAQDVEQYMPYAVTKIKDDVLGQRLNLQYDQFFAPVVGAIQCLDIKVEDHETRLKRLETENVELKNRLSKYETVWQ